MTCKNHPCVPLLAFIFTISVPWVFGADKKDTDHDGMILIPGGTFKMGNEKGYPHEAPVHEVTLDPFWIDRTEVTVDQFKKFISETHYVTDAEKFGWSGCFNLETGLWEKVDKADWRHPFGKDSSPNPGEPVTQVSWNDAMAYAQWAGKRLPTEAEFEYVNGSGKSDRTYGWGKELIPNGKFMANFWQGKFPGKNTRADRFEILAPVASFPPNEFGIHDTTGNVWEWCSDWYDAAYYEKSPKKNPQGPAQGESRVIRGGSWMCSEDFCTGYRISARSQTTPDTGLVNLGFRCVRDASPNPKK